MTEDERESLGVQLLNLLFSGTAIAAFSTNAGAKQRDVPEDWVVGKFTSPDLLTRIEEAFNGLTPYLFDQSSTLLAIMIENLRAEVPTLLEPQCFLKVLIQILTASVLLNIFPKLRTTREWEAYLRLVRESVSPILEPLRIFVVQASEQHVDLKLTCAEHFNMMTKVLKKMDGGMEEESADSSSSDSSSSDSSSSDDEDW
jgi:hypothetical protein